MKSIDSALKVQTPEGIGFVLYPAGFLIRGCAYSVDWFIQLMVVIAIKLWCVYGGFAGGYWFFLLLVFAVDWFYHVFFELCFRGQSIGKRILGIRVVRRDGSPLTPGASFMRNLLRFADVFLFLNLVALLCISLSSGFRRIGDWAGDTLVVYTSRHEAFFQNSLSWLANVQALSPPRPLSAEEKQALLMFARRYPLLGPARADEIARDFAALLRAGEASPVPAGSGGDSAYLLGLARKFSGDAP
ncbi:MAG: RDD family protein [Spirochaetales bacterium]|jgi:uncharacterized RDD family membrane protein YckC|nr:RDD family protein [Spirochaetales bacterium]